MKNLLLFVSILITTLDSYGLPVTKITGFIPEARQSPVEVSLIIKTPSNLRTTSKKYTMMSTEGRFDFAFTIDDLKDISLKINDRNVLFIPVYYIQVEPGDSINVVVPDLKQTGLFNLRFSGRGVEKIELMKSVFQPVLKLFNHDKPTWQQSISERYVATSLKRRVIDSVILANKGLVSEKASSIIKIQSLSSIYDQLLLVATRENPLNHDGKKLFTEYILNSGLADELTRDSLIYYHTMVHVGNNLALLNYAYNTGVSVENLKMEKPALFYKIISDYYASKPVVKDFLLSKYFSVYIKSRGITDSVAPVIETFLLDLDTDNLFFQQLTEQVAMIRKNLATGSSFEDFILEDISGKKVRLGDFKGKVLVLDFWFTGCSGCRQLSPIMTEIEKDWENKPIQFISVSIDKKREDWLKGKGIYSSNSSLQLYTQGQGNKHPLIKYANIGSYPALFLIGKDGKLIEAHVKDPRRDKKAFLKTLEDAL